MDADKVSNSTLVDVNAGGTLFRTTVSTLVKYRRSYFDVLFSSKMKLVIKDAAVQLFVDIEPDIFGKILNFLRSGNWKSMWEQYDSVKYALDMLMLTNDVKMHEKKVFIIDNKFITRDHICEIDDFSDAPVHTTLECKNIRKVINYGKFKYLVCANSVVSFDTEKMCVTTLLQYPSVASINSCIYKNLLFVVKLFVRTLNDAKGVSTMTIQSLNLDTNVCCDIIDMAILNNKLQGVIGYHKIDVCEIIKEKIIISVCKHDVSKKTGVSELLIFNPTTNKIVLRKDDIRKTFDICSDTIGRYTNIISYKDFIWMISQDSANKISLENDVHLGTQSIFKITPYQVVKKNIKDFYDNDLTSIISLKQCSSYDMPLVWSYAILFDYDGKIVLTSGTTNKFIF